MRWYFLLFYISISTSAISQQVSINYFPGKDTWHAQPPVLYFDTTKLAQAIAFARQSESKTPRDLSRAHELSFGKEPFGFAVGPFSERGIQTGIIIHKGFIMAEWGEPSRVDMTFSVTKSFLSTVVGLAVDMGLIRSVDDKISDYVRQVEIFNPRFVNDTVTWSSGNMIHPFSSPHNQNLSWDVMLRQTSDWEGTLWSKPDWADRPDKDSTKWLNRTRNKPGTVYEYNDVRVNALVLAATHVWRQPLPEVLKENIMDPIGASSTWRWTGYQNSWIILDGRVIQSVSGGGHWGGGMFINAYDMARFGLLTLHKGNWNGKQLISQKWIGQALQPTPVQTGYGYMNFFLNTNNKFLPSAPPNAFVHVGNGANLIYVDPDNDLVMVLRWIQNNRLNETIKMVLEALKK